VRSREDSVTQCHTMRHIATHCSSQQHTCRRHIVRENEMTAIQPHTDTSHTQTHPSFDYSEARHAAVRDTTDFSSCVHHAAGVCFLTVSLARALCFFLSRVLAHALSPPLSLSLSLSPLSLRLTLFLSLVVSASLSLSLLPPPSLSLAYFEFLFLEMKILSSSSSK